MRAAICPYCNSDVRTGKAEKRQVEVKKRSNGPVLIAAGVAVLVAVLGVVLLLVLKK